MSIIVVVEPHTLLRLGLLQVLSAASPDAQIYETNYSQISTVGCSDQAIDLVILSLSSIEQMAQLVATVNQSFVPRAILLLADSDLEADVLHTCPPNVAGYVLKHSAPEVMQAAVKLVLAGGTCFPLVKRRAQPTPPAAESAASLLSAAPAQLESSPACATGSRKSAKSTGANLSECEKLSLTPRQYEVLVLLARGYPMKTVGRLLNISVATAKAHTEMLYQRLDVHNRNAAVYEAVSRGATLGWPSIEAARQSVGKLTAN